MTLSIVVREPTDPGDDPSRFGVAATTNNPGIGVFCPFVSEHGAVATQYETHGEVGPWILRRIDAGEPAAEVLPDVLSEIDRAERLQIHAHCRNTSTTHHGEAVEAFHGDNEMVYGAIEGPNYSVAGNCLESLEVLDAVADAYEEADPDRELSDRLISALIAGEDAGGDARDATARSAAVRVVDPQAGLANEWYNDLRVDAAERPLSDIRSQYDLAKAHHEAAAADW